MSKHNEQTNERNLDSILQEMKTSKSRVMPDVSNDFAVPEASHVGQDQVATPISAIVLPPNVRATRFRDRLRETRLMSAKQFEATEITLDTQLEKLRHQAEAIKRESKAICDAKSVEVAENIKAYFQAKIGNLENERLTSRNEAVDEASKRTAQKMEEVLNGPLPDELKKGVIERLLKILEGTLERHDNNTIAEKYGLV